MTLFYLFIFMIGASIGSFLNVCIYRLPLEQSIVSPPSHCPVCNTPIRFYDNIPVLSFIILGGRCRTCRTPISVQYVSVEIFNAVGYIFLFREFGLSPTFIIYAIFFSSLVVLSVIDLYYKILPDIITIPGIILGLISSSLILSTGFKSSLVGLLIGGGLFYIVSVGSLVILNREGMGGGDVKLIAMIGAFLGWRDVIVTIMLASLIGSIVGIFMMIFFGKDRKYQIPFGPFLALGGMISMFFSEAIIEWYLGITLHY
ncbi:MAG: prepilin peptidase [Nitrospirae bacterium]|nr:prepilin peptidase [Nitrospirota bacterium]